MLRPLDTASDADDPGRLRQVDGLPSLAKWGLGLLPDGGSVDRDWKRADGGGGCPARRRVGPKGSDLYRDNRGPSLPRGDVAHQLALKHGPGAHDLATRCLHAGPIGTERPIE